MSERPERHVRLSPFNRAEMGAEDRERVMGAFTDAFLDRSQQTHLGAGTTAEVLAHREDPALKGFVSKFAYADRPHPGILNDLETEFDMQLRAWQMVESWPTKYPKAARVHVPEPIGYVREDGNEVLVMERVSGKTLWRLLLENYLRTEGVSAGVATEKDIADLCALPDDRDVEDFVIRRTGMALLYQQGRHKDIEKAMWETCWRKQSAVVTESQFKAIQTFAALAKREKFWHRDFHPKNVMIDDQDRVFVIDFGLSAAGMEEGQAMNVQSVGQDMMLTAGYEGLIEQLRESGNGEERPGEARGKRAPLASWRRKP